jgi:urease accessory protein UreF
MEFEGDLGGDRGIDVGVAHADHASAHADHASAHADHASDRGTDVLVSEGLGFDPFTDSAEVILDHVCDLEPGLFVQSVLEMLDPASLSSRDAVRYLQVHERIASWWASRQYVGLIAAAGRIPVVEEFVLLDRLSDSERTVRIGEMARDEIAAALRWGPMSTQSRIDQARLLAGPLVATHEALSLGEITPIHVRILTEAAQRLSTWDALEQVIHDATVTGTDTAQDQIALVLAQAAFEEDCVALQHRVLPLARRQGFTRTKAAANRAIEKIDAAGQARRRAAARRHRDVYLTSDDDGLTTLIARLDTFTANAIMGAINAGITNPAITGSCATTVGERRSEVLAALIFGVYAKSASTANAGCMGGCTTPLAVSVTIDLTVPISELDAHLHSPNATGTGAHTVTDAATGTGGPIGSSRGVDSIGCDFWQLLADPAIKVFA